MTMTKKSFRKGDTVELDVAVCFTDRIRGGETEFPLCCIYHDERGEVRAARPCTAEENVAWYASDDSKGIDSAGEAKLPPRSIGVFLKAGDTFIVLRARTRVVLSWGNARGGFCHIERSDGENAFVRRELLRVV